MNMAPGLYYLNGVDDADGIGKISLKKIGKGIAKGVSKVAKTAVKVATTPLRLAAKAIVEIAIPKAAMSFLYLFINRPEVLEKMPQAVKDKRAKAQKTANFITKKIGMKESHLMDILRKGIQKKTGRSPEDNLRELFPGAGIGLLPVALPALKVGLPLLKTLFSQLAKIFGGGDLGNPEEMQPEESDFEGATDEGAEAIEGLGAVKKAAGKAKTAVKKVAVKATKKVAVAKKAAKTAPGKKATAIVKQVKKAKATAALPFVPSARTKELMNSLPTATAAGQMLKLTATAAKATTLKKKVATKQKSKAAKIIATGLAVVTTAAELIKTAQPTNQEGVLKADDGSLLINNQDGGTTIKTPGGNEVTLTADGKAETPTGVFEIPASKQEEIRQTIQQANTDMDVKTGGQEANDKNVQLPVEETTRGEDAGQYIKPLDPAASPYEGGSGYTQLPDVTVTPKGKNDNNGLLIGLGVAVAALALSGGSSRKR